jgi:hypothetical protein
VLADFSLWSDTVTMLRMLCSVVKHNQAAIGSEDKMPLLVLYACYLAKDRKSCNTFRRFRALVRPCAACRWLKQPVFEAVVFDSSVCS